MRSNRNAAAQFPSARTLTKAAAGGPGRADPVVCELARFRYALRRFLRFSENAARQCGVTPQQHQLMLGVAGFTGRGSATISELAEFLQERNHSVVGLVARAAQSGLVRSAEDSVDRRVVVVSLTARGRTVLERLTRLHRGEAARMQSLILEMQDAPQKPLALEGA